jgi:ribosomal protein S21
MLKIIVKNGDINRALKELKSKVYDTRMILELQERKEYKKKSIKKRKSTQKARYLQQKKAEN